jgi:HSP20 family protein
MNYLKLPVAKTESERLEEVDKMRTMNRWEPPRGGSTTLQEQLNRVFGNVLERAGDESNLTPWAPAVDIFETEHELVVKADLPDVNPQDLDIHVENNILTIRGERKFENQEKEENYLRIERAYGSFSRTFSLANTVNSDAIKADYKNGVLILSIPKREEAKPKQIKVNVGAPALAAAAGAR